MIKYYFLIFFLLNICIAQETIINTEPSVSKEVKKNLMTLLQYEIKGKFKSAYELMTDEFLIAFGDKKGYEDWAKSRFNSLTYVPKLKFSSFFIKKKIRKKKTNYVVQFTLADKKGRVLIADDDSCYIFSKRKGTFKAHLFIYDCNPYD